MHVQDFGTLAIQPLTEAGNMAQGAQPFFANGPVKMFSAARAHAVTQWTVGRDH